MMRNGLALGIVCAAIASSACDAPPTRLGGDSAVTLDEKDAADGCVLIEDRVVCNHGHALNLRAENLRERRLYLEARGVPVDDSTLMASDRDGSLGTEMPDPVTRILRARLGDTVRIRVLSYGPEMHTFHVHGHIWLDTTGLPTDNVDLLPAETLQAEFSAGGGPLAGSPERGGPGDWMYHCHVQGHITSGMWSLFRVMEPGAPDLALEADGRFPGETPPPVGGVGETVELWIVAMDAPITVTREYSPLIDGFRSVRRPARVYVPVTQAAFDSASRPAVDPDSFEPWVLSVAVGTRIRLHLKNLVADAPVPVSLHPHGLVYAEEDDGGTPGSIAARWGDVVDYDYVADAPGVWPYHDHAMPHENIPRGLLSAIIVWTPEQAASGARDYVVIFSDLDFAWLNDLGGEAGGHDHP
jgi:hypothetical protein